MTEDEFFDNDEDTKSVNEVEDVPQGFKDWVKDNEERIDKATERGKLPYFIADNKKVVENILRGGSGTNGNSKDDAEATRIEANRREYERLKADPNYTAVKFNPKNGGLKATHVEHETHNNDKTLYFGKFKPNDLELMAQNILYNNGYSCILESEMIFNSMGIQQVSLDTTTNSERMDIKSITKNGKNTLKNAIRDKKAQITKFNENNDTDYHSLILYFHDKDMFNEQSVRKLLGKTLKRFICIIEPNTIKVIE